jgi:very-short-patch-repair endonuclease
MRGKQDHGRERTLRREQTESERILWTRLRDRRLSNFKFRRQHRIGPYFTDFVCTEVGLVIELDGSQHLDQIDYDIVRSQFLQSQGYRVLRFWNDEVLFRMDDVLDEILRALRTPHPPAAQAPSPR